jgi:hypothetical protein
MKSKDIVIFVVITLPDGQVISKEILTRIDLTKGHCPKLATVAARKRLLAETRSGIKVEVF